MRGGIVRRRIGLLALIIVAVGALMAATSPQLRHSVATLSAGAPRAASTGQLPAPPSPPAAAPSATGAAAATGDAVTVAFAGVSAGAPGADNTRRTLVLYDTTGSWGWLGEAYAVQAANLLSHGSGYVLRPVGSYQAGDMAGYTGVVYIGSTYDEPLPTAFLDDTLAGSRPVLWMNDNIWQLTQRAGDFTTRYGWNWQQFDFAATPTVTYKGVALQRDSRAASSGLLTTAVTDPAKATVLATARRTDGTTEPWAIRSGQLTYIAEIPFSYVGPTDRYFAAADLLALLANPAHVNRKRALVRIEDVGPDADPAELRQVADYLSAQHVPFTVGIIPKYVDPKGYYNDGKPVSITLAQAPKVVSALKYMQSKGGTLIMHGYTHQYGTLNNPYNGVTGDDFEFYTAHIDSANYVVYDGPVPADSATWAQSRITAASTAFRDAGLAVPTIFEAPHYAASATDYAVFAKNFAVRYDRVLYFGGWCPSGACGTGTPNYQHMYGQYFPYLVRDVYGTVVLPEQLGDVEPEPFNNNPARLPADLLAGARAASVVTDGVQSFYYHPYLGTGYLKQLVSGIKGMGYQFVSAGTVAAG